MDFLNLANLIVKDWGLLMIFFGAGIGFYKAKAWVEHLHDCVEAVHKKLDSTNVKLDALVEKTTKHDAELIRNTEQHAAIVKALDGHVQDNKHHDQDVKQALAVILDRLQK